MSKFNETNEKIVEGITEGYEKIEEGVVSGYKKIETGVVEGFSKMTDKFVGKFLIFIALATMVVLAGATIILY